MSSTQYASPYTHAVIDDTKIIYRRGTAPLVRLPLASEPDLGQLLALADSHKLETFWACPGSRLSLNTTPAYIQEPASALGYNCSVGTRPRGRGQEPRITRASLWRAEGTRAQRRSIYVNFPQWDRWDWEDTDALSILAGIHYTERALPVSISRGAALAGRELLQGILGTRRAHWAICPDIALWLAIPFDEAGKDLAYKGGPLVYRQGLYLHAYDKNSQYLGAACGALLGEGMPDYYAPGARHEPDLKRPGFWRVRLAPGSARQGWLEPLYEDQEWLSTPLLAYCLDLGYRAEVLEGYQWQKAHRTLEDWADKLWKTRTSVKTDAASYPHERGRKLAYENVKSIATAGLGLLASDKTAKYSPDWYRADFWVTVVELAKVRIMRKVAQIEAALGLLPLAIATDCLYYVSTEPDPHKAIPGITDKAEGLGGYKVKHSFLLTPALVDEMNEAESGGDVARIARLHEQALAA